MSFEIVKHTADIKIKICARDLAELLVEALKGMNEILMPVESKTDQSKTVRINIDSIDQSALVVDFLSEVLAR